MEELPWQTLLPLGLTLLIALLGSRVLGTWIEQGFTRRQKRRDRNYDDATGGLEALNRLRRASLQHGARGRDSDTERDDQMAELSNSLLVAVARTGRTDLVKLAHSYTIESQLFATGSEDVTAQSEEDSFLALLKALSQVSKSAR